MFSDIIIPVDALLCNNAHCTEHVTDIDNFYICIINGIQSAEKKWIPFELSIGINSHTVPGWNEYVKDNHAVARDAFWLWNFYGRPNQDICASICAESLRCAQLSVLLSFCFSLFLSHGYLPPILIETTIVPTIKDKFENISSSSNYRPIALVTIISKLLESILLLKCEEYLCTSVNQFGFTRANGTELCIYTLREYIELYRKQA